LYSLREKFNKNDELNLSKNEFEFYGKGWNHEKYPNYVGAIEEKLPILSKYRFTLCFENMKNIDGYITEKIFHAFAAGVVPVYLGASNIKKYIPESTFIDYSEFQSNQDLLNFLRMMTYQEWMTYVNSANEFIDSDAGKLFSHDNYFSILHDAILRTNGDIVSTSHFFDINLYLRSVYSKFLSRLILRIRKMIRA
jgi:hypothetical protein